MALRAPHTKGLNSCLIEQNVHKKIFFFCKIPKNHVFINHVIAEKDDDLLSGEETLISGPAFSESRQKMRETENLEMVDDLIQSKPFSALRDVTNADRLRRKSVHKQIVESTASPNLCKKSLEGKENDNENEEV